MTPHDRHSTSPPWSCCGGEGIAAELLLLSSATALTVIFFVLLSPVNRPLAWLALFFNLVSISVEAGASVDLVEALLPLGTPEYLAAFERAQLHALTRLATRSHAHGFGVALPRVCRLRGTAETRSA